MPANFQLPIRGEAFVFYVTLVDQANTKLFKANPTLAAGDVKVSKDGGTAANLATLPTVSPASGVRVKVELSAAEMEADDVSVVFSDAAGAEWCDYHVPIKPYGAWIKQLIDLCERAYDLQLGRVKVDVDSYRGGKRFMPVDSNRPKWAISGATLSAKDPDGNVEYTKALGTAPADPVISSE